MYLKLRESTVWCCLMWIFEISCWDFRNPAQGHRCFELFLLLHSATVEGGLRCAVLVLWWWWSGATNPKGVRQVSITLTVRPPTQPLRSFLIIHFCNICWIFKSQHAHTLRCFGSLWLLNSAQVKGSWSWWLYYEEQKLQQGREAAVCQTKQDLISKLMKTSPVG